MKIYRWLEGCSTTHSAREIVFASHENLPRQGRSEGTDQAPCRRHHRAECLWQRCGGLGPVVAALAELNDGELCALIEVTNNVPQFVPGLLAWIGHACDWELNRRAFVNFPLQSPESAIRPEENSASIVAMIILRARFDQGAGGMPVPRLRCLTQ